MVRTVGIDPGEYAVKVVELDGSYRKTRLLQVHTETIKNGVSRADAIAGAARTALDAGMKGEVLLGHPCREAVLRQLELPFRGREAIKKVVKAEIEGEIHGYSVDDMIVDFHEIGSTPEGGTRILVASVPKEGLRSTLAALTANKIEPEVVDLDTMALWRVADWAGAFEAAEAGEATGPADGRPPVTAVIDLGARSVRVLMVEGSQLVEMRALRIGDTSAIEDLARRGGISQDAAREAMLACTATGADHHLTVEEALPAPTGDEENAPPAEPKTREVTVSVKDVQAAQAAFLQRLSRELVRHLTSTGRATRIGKLWVTGGMCRMPGVAPMLQEVFGVMPQELELLGKLQHDLDPEVANELGPRIATALGLALGKLGGPAGFNLRQEDLAFTRGFERIKFPLAITCMIALLALFVFGNKRLTELKLLELQIGKTFRDPKNPKAPPDFHGQTNSALGKWFESPQHFRWEQSKGKDYTHKNLIEELEATPVHKRIQLIHDKLKLVADQRQKESGIYEDVSLESGLAVLVRFSQIMKSIEPQLGRYLMTKLSVDMKSPRQLVFQVAFRGDDFRDKSSLVQQAFDAELEKPDTPFEKPKGLSTGAKEDVFKDYEKTQVRGAYFTFTVKVKDSFDPFGPSSKS